jgi:hypothetical protein
MPAAADDDGAEDMDVVATRGLDKLQELIDTRIGMETAASTEGQASLQDLHDACAELVAVPNVLRIGHSQKGSSAAAAAAAADDGAIDMLAVSELTGLSVAEERHETLLRIARMSSLDPPPWEADVLRGQLDFVSDQQAYWHTQQTTVRALPGRVSARSISHSNRSLDGGFVWTRTALSGPFRRFPARAD